MEKTIDLNSVGGNGLGSMTGKTETAIASDKTNR